MLRASLVLLSVLTLGLAACGGKADGDSEQAMGGNGGSAPGSGGTTGTPAGGTATSVGGSTATMPSQCTDGAVTPAAPMPVTFTLSNVSPNTVYLSTWRTCRLDFTIYSCADGYTNPIVSSVNCMSSCSSGPNTCVACGMCASSAPMLVSGASITASWGGEIYDVSTNGSCPCYDSRVAPGGKYRIVVDVYDGVDAAMGSADPSRKASADFTYPVSSGNVVVNL